jgi:hypothetical protein
LSGSGDDAALPGSIATEHRYELPVDRPTIWALISDVDAYQGWWPWLRHFEAGGLAAGEEWRCEVQPPLPYAVRFRVLIDQVEAPLEVRARIEGDVIGTATLTLEEHPGGSTGERAGPGEQDPAPGVAPGFTGGALRPRLGARLRCPPVHRPCRHAVAP